MPRRNISSGYAFEETYGYSRAVRVGGHVYVSGTTARGAALADDAYRQARAILDLIGAALTEAGAQMRHVVRTVIYVTDLADRDSVAKAHGEVFGTVRPASTLVQVVALTPETALVEIEATAFRWLPLHLKPRWSRSRRRPSSRNDPPLAYVRLLLTYASSKIARLLTGLC